MKVIAINDAPILKTPYYFNGVQLNRAYYKGDIFEIRHIQGNSNYMEIYHDKIKKIMEVQRKNFISLDEHRQIKIDKILLKKILKNDN